MPISEALLQFDRRDPQLYELPNEVAIEILMGCNLRCPMCPVSGLPHTMNGRRQTIMSADLYQRVIDQISDRPRSILLNVFTEPLLHPRLVEFIRIGKAAGHHVAIITNGTKLTRAYSASLIEAGLDALTMSIDGLRDDTYGVMRVGANRQAVMRNLRELADENRARGNPLRIEINYLLTSATAPEIAAFWSEYSPLVSVINLIPVTAWGNQWSLPEWMPEDTADPRLVPKGGARSAARTPCPHIWRALWVSAEGRVMLCTNDYEQHSALPYMQDKSLLDIWREDVGRIRREQADGCFDRKPCSTCWLNDVAAAASPEDRRRAFAAARRGRLEAAIPVAWVPSSLKPLRAKRDAPWGCVDKPVPDATVTGLVVVAGWAIAAPGRRRVASIEIRVDGVGRGLALYDLFRADVGEAHPGEGHSFSGFSYSLDTRCLSNGAHTLDAIVEDGHGHRVILQPRTIHVAN